MSKYIIEMEKIDWRNEMPENGEGVHVVFVKDGEVTMDAYIKDGLVKLPDGDRVGRQQMITDRDELKKVLLHVENGVLSIGEALDILTDDRNIGQLKIKLIDSLISGEITHDEYDKKLNNVMFDTMDISEVIEEILEDFSIRRTSFEQCKTEIMKLIKK